jgi:protein TonB
MATAITHPGVTANDRLSFTLFLAVALHAAVILGVTFTYLKKSSSTHTMEITLAQHRSKNQPDKADFLAQFSQSGSGTLAEKALLTSPTKAEFHDTVIRETMPIQQTAVSSTTVQKQKPVVTTIASSTSKALVENKSDSDKPSVNPLKGKKSLLQRSLEIASLEARLDRQRQTYAKRPRIKRLTSLSTTSSSDAYYLNSWRRKIEKFGNINYPAEARRKKLYGSLRLMVAVLPDGSLKEVKLLESSGHQVLDNSAISIVKLASPFAPFPDELRKSTDLLEIIRTWQFRENSSLRSF